MSRFACQPTMHPAALRAARASLRQRGWGNGFGAALQGEDARGKFGHLLRLPGITSPPLL
jgi:hypothetical protein